MKTFRPVFTKNPLIALFLIFFVSVSCEKQLSFNEKEKLSQKEQEIFETIIVDPSFDVLSKASLRIKYYAYKTGLSYEEIDNFSKNKGNISYYSKMITNAGVRKSDIVYDMNIYKQFSNNIVKNYPISCDAKKLRKALNQKLIEEGKKFLQNEKEQYLNNKLQKRGKKREQECDSNKECSFGKLCCRAFAENKSVCKAPIINDDGDLVCPVFSLEFEELVLTNDKPDIEIKYDSFSKYFNFFPRNFFTGTVKPIKKYPYYEENDSNNKWFSGGYSPASTDSIIPDNKFKNSVANCVYKLLLDNKQFKEILDEIIPKTSEYNVFFTMGKTKASGGKTTATYKTIDKNIIITINEVLIEEKSVPTIAEVILHESVHARLYQKVKAIGGLKKIPFTKGDSDIEKLANYYCRYGNDREMQHETIWINYVGKIAKGVKAIHKLFPDDYKRFHKNMIGTDGYSEETFYTKVAQASLSETSYFKNIKGIKTNKGDKYNNKQKEILNMSNNLKVNAKKIANSKTCE